MFIKTYNSRYEKDLYSYSRLVDASSSFCLCSYCEMSNIPEGIICQKHEKFMRLTEELEIAAPVFACAEFVELEGSCNYLSLYYDGDNLSSKSVGAIMPQIRDRIRQQWKAQKELWAREQNGTV